VLQSTGGAMRKLLCWAITLTSIAYTLWMMIIMFKHMPDPDTADRAEYTRWAIGSLVGITLFWLMPVLGVWFLVWVWNSREREEEEQNVYIERPMIERPLTHHGKHYDADENVVSIRRASFSLQHQSRR
jgi:hypothetical protein